MGSKRSDSAVCRESIWEKKTKLKEMGYINSSLTINLNISYTSGNRNENLYNSARTGKKVFWCKTGDNEKERKKEKCP